MASQYRVLPSASEHIRAVMDALRIAPIDPKFTPELAARRQDRFYMTPVHWRGQVVWFKAMLQRAPGLERALLYEIKVQRAFADYEQSHRPSFDSPSFLRAGKRGPVRWLLRRYWLGWFAGSMTTSFGWQPKFLRTVTPQRLARIVADVRRMTPFVRRRLSLGRHDGGWYLFDFRYYRRHFLAPLIRHRLNPNWTSGTVRHMERVIRQASPFLRREAQWFTHGDLYPNNVLITGRGRPRVILFDWELVHLNVAAFDPVMVWLMAWQNPAWQERFRAAIRAYLPAGAVGRRAWNLAQLSLSLRLAGFAFIRLTNTQPDRYEPLPKRYRKTIARMFHRMVQNIDGALAGLEAAP